LFYLQYKIEKSKVKAPLEIMNYRARRQVAGGKDYFICCRTFSTNATSTSANSAIRVVVKVPD